MGRKRCISSFGLQLIIERHQGKNSVSLLAITYIQYCLSLGNYTQPRKHSRTRGKMLLDGSLVDSCLDCELAFLYSSRSFPQGMVPPTVGWDLFTSPDNQDNPPQACPQANLNWKNPSTETPFCIDSRLCQDSQPLK